MAGYIGNKSSVVSSGAERKFKFAITETTTTLSNLAYTRDLVHVFHNGVRLVDGTDYTATNGTSITLTNAAENGDEVVVVSYASFQPSDTVSASTGGVFEGNITVNGDLTVDADTLFVDTANNRVGIRTNSPAYRLDVSAPGGAIARFINGSSGGTPSNTHGELIVESGEANMGIQLLGTATSNQKILFGDSGSAGSGQLVYDHTSNYMSFFTNTSERMRIDSSGNVGIGTSSPATTLDVAGTITSDGLTVGGTGAEAAGSQLLKVRNSTTGEAVTIGLYAKADNGGDGNSGSITFDAGASGVSADNELRFNADHQTGTNPALSIYGNGDISFYEDTGTTPKFFWDASAESLGIGTSSPAARLEVNSSASSGRILLSANDLPMITNGFDKFTSGAYQGAGSWGLFMEHSTLTVGAYNTGSIAFKHFNADSTSTERMRIDSSGRVTMPYQPAFRVGLNGAANYLNVPIKFNSVSGTAWHFNRGNHYNASTGVFTCPVGGVYSFYAMVIHEGVPNNTDMTDSFFIRINGSFTNYGNRRAMYVAGTTGNGGYFVESSAVLISAAANDAITVISAKNLLVHGNPRYTVFHGYLIG